MFPRPYTAAGSCKRVVAGGWPCIIYWGKPGPRAGPATRFGEGPGRGQDQGQGQAPTLFMAHRAGPSSIMGKGPQNGPTPALWWGVPIAHALPALLCFSSLGMHAGDVDMGVCAWTPHLPPHGLQKKTGAVR